MSTWRVRAVAMAVLNRLACANRSTTDDGDNKTSTNNWA